jgi:N-glycosylase/DNA lyase
VTGWSWLANYLQTDVDLPSILQTFPDDEPMRVSVAACRGLRLLRQEPWECLASFIVSSTKQIVQINKSSHCCANASARRWSPRPVTRRYSRSPQPIGSRRRRIGIACLQDGFPRALRVGRRTPCRFGRRLDLRSLQTRSVEEARELLVQLPGVGEDRQLRAALRLWFQQAFPIDV